MSVSAPVFGLTPLGMQVAGIFIGTILLWMFVSVTWPSILCIIALILSPLYTYSSGLSGSMGAGSLPLCFSAPW